MAFEAAVVWLGMAIVAALGAAVLLRVAYVLMRSDYVVLEE